MSSLHCLCCKKELASLELDAPHQPIDGVMCFSEGNFGSAAFDPMDGSRLFFVVCDECLRQNAKLCLVFVDGQSEPLPAASIL